MQYMIHTVIYDIKEIKAANSVSKAVSLRDAHERSQMVWVTECSAI
jgi:hypothetical protein